MYIAIIKDRWDDTSTFEGETKQELEEAILEYVTVNLEQGDSMTVQYFEPTVKKTVRLDYVWTEEGGKPSKRTRDDGASAIEV